MEEKQPDSWKIMLTCLSANENRCFVNRREKEKKIIDYSMRYWDTYNIAQRYVRYCLHHDTRSITIYGGHKIKWSTWHSNKNVSPWKCHTSRTFCENVVKTVTRPRTVTGSWKQLTTTPTPKQSHRIFVYKWIIEKRDKRSEGEGERERNHPRNWTKHELERA